jgi:hypothetical protein
MAFKIAQMIITDVTSVTQTIGAMKSPSGIGGGNRSTQRKPLTYRKSLTNFIHDVVSSTPHLSGIRTHNISGDRH